MNVAGSTEAARNLFLSLVQLSGPHVPSTPSSETASIHSGSSSAHDSSEISPNMRVSFDTFRQFIDTLRDVAPDQNQYFHKLLQLTGTEKVLLGCPSLHFGSLLSGSGGS